MRPGTSTGPFLVRTANASAYSAAFAVPSHIVIEGPAAVLAGARASFHARVSSAADRAVSWDVVGGPANGSIDSTGLFSAPATRPASGEVRLRATLAASPSTQAERVIAILLPLPRPGRSLILASQGGTIQSEDGAAALTIPPGALEADTEITIAPEPFHALPDSTIGGRSLGAIVLSPSGLSFSSPATARIPLRRFVPPGTRLSLELLDEVTGLPQGAATEALVDETGTAATGLIPHFTAASVVDPNAVQVALPAPALAAITPSEGEEGRTLPIRVTGSNLLPDTRIRVLRDGQPTNDLQVGPLFASGASAGFELRIGVLPALTTGQSASYTLEACNEPCTAVATLPFTVRGLPELHVPLGVTQAAPPVPTRYSAILIEGTLRAGSAHIELGANRGIELTATGRIDASGAPGADAQGHLGGAGGQTDGSPFFAGGAGGRGGIRAPGFDGATAGFVGRPFWGPGADTLGGVRGPEPAAGMSAGFRGLGTYGYGGAAGRNKDLLELIVDAAALILDFVTLVQNVVGCVTTGSTCLDVIRGVVDVVLGVVELIEHLEKQPPIEHGLGGEGGYCGFFAYQGCGWQECLACGGGGGGGGATSAALYGAGGGGGGGGAPGWRVRLRSFGPLTLAGTITTRGGDGGRGDAASTTFLLDSGDAARTGPPGGGGGGGASADIELLARAGVYRAPTAALNAVGGEGGRPGIVRVDIGDPEDLRIILSAGRGGRGKSGSPARLVGADRQSNARFQQGERRIGALG